MSPAKSHGHQRVQLMRGWRQVAGRGSHSLVTISICPPDNPMAIEPLIDVTSFLSDVSLCQMACGAHHPRVTGCVARSTRLPHPLSNNSCVF